jgi:F-type H+-transporting ATPase subunit delta
LREPTIARNYAEALFESGEHSGETERYADLMKAIADSIRSDDTIRHVLESPRVPKHVKQDVLSKALEEYAPSAFIKFLAAVVKRGRQTIMTAICDEYLNLVDRKFNRVHAGITLAREPDGALQEAVKQRLSVVMGKEVIPRYRTDPDILGGLIVRVGDRIMDGSLRRRMVSLRSKLLGQ